MAKKRATEHEHLELRLADLSYVVNAPGQPGGKQLLNNVSFACENGRLCAIMGPSGAGKTTLLNILAGEEQVTYRRIV